MNTENRIARYPWRGTGIPIPEGGRFTPQNVVVSDDAIEALVAKLKYWLFVWGADKYAFQIRRDGRTKSAWAYYNGYARGPLDGNITWGSGTTTQLASISKTITAMVITKLFNITAAGGADEKIIGYLPEYWFKGPFVDELTVNHLLAHVSGLDWIESSPGTGHFAQAELAIALGAASSPNVANNYVYMSVNYALLRVIAAKKIGDTKLIEGQLGPTQLLDALWDQVTTNSFARYVYNKIFQPAGV
ncbi:MAG: beta-lactamase family protein, partial [Candidatus Dormibacteraeota bacterium]|nr:beta-lactamase family protein [Candidatus Dormibacteraeota bacterium]